MSGIHGHGVMTSPWQKKKAHRDGHKGQVVGPGTLGSDSVCATGKLLDMPQAPHVMGQRAPIVGLVWGMTGNVLKTAKPSGREGVCSGPQSPAGHLLTGAAA